MDINLNEILTNLLLAFLTAAIPVVVGLIRSWLQRQARRLELEIGERNYWLLQTFARDVVSAAEQTLQKAGIDKKRYAVDAIERMAKEAGIPISRAQIEALIEAAVYDLKNNKGATGLTVVGNG